MSARLKSTVVVASFLAAISTIHLGNQKKHFHLTSGPERESLRDAPGGAPSDPHAGEDDALDQLRQMAGASASPEAPPVSVSVEPPVDHAAAVDSACGRPIFDDYKHDLDSSRQKEFADKPARYISNANMAEVRTRLGDLKPVEDQIISKALANPPYVTHWMQSQWLRETFANGAVLSENRQGYTHAKTAWIEQELFGGHDCVFAAVGPEGGRSRYGDVMLLLNDDAPAPAAWASTGSGMHFMCERYQLPWPCGNYPHAGWKDRVAFAEHVYARPDWNQKMAFAIIRHIRELSSHDQREAMRSRLLSAPGRKEFWDIVDANRLGYLEAKFPDSIPLDEVSAVYVPKAMIQDILAWPESARWKDKIRPLEDGLK